ncbi:hypothetical protein V865_001334 [Kwoniella europaea PYCC6329]|uniref:Uncharacterized protein n=1 Tax=Kwoniella europaea PYCC6329 TaxID=1423913 RepID=A0AAX4KBL5_9TREE
MSSSQLTIQQFTYDPHTDLIQSINGHSELSSVVIHDGSPRSESGKSNESLENHHHHRDPVLGHGFKYVEIELDTYFQRYSQPPLKKSNHGTYRIYSTARYYPDSETLERFSITASPTSEGDMKIVNTMSEDLNKGLDKDLNWFRDVINDHHIEPYLQTERTLFNTIILKDENKTKNGKRNMVDLHQVTPEEFKEITGIELPNKSPELSPYSSDSELDIEGLIPEEEEESICDISQLLNEGQQDQTKPSTTSQRTKKQKHVKRLSKRLKYVWNTKLNCFNKLDEDWEEGEYGMVPTHSELLFN